MTRLVPVGARRILAAVLVWVVVVAVGSTVVWTVISRAGDPSGGGGGLPARAIDPASPSAPQTTSGGPTGGATPSATPSATAGPTRGPGGPGTSVPETGFPEERPDHGTRPKRRTWSGRAGVVTVECTGSRIRLVQASPSTDGYWVEVDKRGPVEVRVEFEGEDSDSRVRVRAWCADASPQYAVDG